MKTRFLKRPVVSEISGHSRSGIYANIKAGLWPRPVKLGRTSVWPEHEIEAINAARLAGKTDDEIRGLVTALHADRVSYGSGS